MTSSNDIANEAIQLIGGNQPFVTGQNPTWDNSASGLILQKIYSSCVATVQRQFGWDASRNQSALQLSGNAAPAGWLYEYLYPSNGIEVWQISPASLTDQNNPLPVDWNVGNNLAPVQGISTQVKVIWTNVQNAVAIYNNNPVESVWDSLFREEVVRLLASELSMALAGKPDAAQGYFEGAAGFGNLNETRIG
jgi:hypothetical protein